VATRRGFLKTAALLTLPLPSLAETLDIDPTHRSSEIDFSHSQLQPYLERYAADRDLLTRFYPVPFAPETQARMRRFFEAWQRELSTLPYATLAVDSRIDYVLTQSVLTHDLRQLDLDAAFQQDVALYLPFAPTILELETARRDMHPIDAKTSAAALAQLADQIQSTRTTLEASLKADPKAQQNRQAANTAIEQLATLTDVLHTWFQFYDGYDPEFTWWAEQPYKAAQSALTGYSTFLSETILHLPPAPTTPVLSDSSDPGSDDAAYQRSLAAARPDSTADIIGHAIGAPALQAELAAAFIPYTPQQLIAIANQEFAWCDARMLEASRDCGFGDNWHAALDKVKNTYVDPGRQPDLVRQLEQEAEHFLDAHDLVTVPALVRETWRRRMIPPRQQLISPFFLGGEVMQIAYPTNTMTYAQRLTAMRANNIAMSRATVFHELIPGHELQLFMLERFRAYRRVLGETPFLIEGWALYWEMLLWDLGFHKTPEQRIGALAWRMHRCARIIFSLSFHLGVMTPQQSIDFLVTRVGFEPSAAAGEVRRSFGGAYTPLYQAAYLLGGLQLRALHKELVPARLSNRQFHDAVLRENAIPIELIRVSLLNLSLPANYQPSWKFYGEVQP
jgi:hypothetical protein